MDYGMSVCPPAAPNYAKDPSDTVDYPMSWHQLGADSIVTSVWESDGLSVLNNSISGLNTNVFVSGGRAGAIHNLTNTITTAMGRTLQRTIYVAVSEL